MPHDVIIIDDDKNVAATLEMYCEQAGIFRHIILSHDGVDATIKINNQAFSAIILDINLPKKSGLDILKSIEDSALNKINKVVLISGEMSKENLSRAVNMGVKHFLVKPFDTSSFVDKLKKVLATK